MKIQCQKFIFLLLGIWILSLGVISCGFSPLYGDNKEGEDRITELAAVEIETIQGRIGQRLKGQLEDLLNPKQKQITKTYLLNLTMQIYNTPFGIQQDSRITRYKTVIGLNYILTEKETGKIVSKGIIERHGGYDALDSDYATYVSEKDNERRIVKELAEDIKLRLTSLLIQ